MGAIRLLFYSHDNLRPRALPPEPHDRLAPTPPSARDVGPHHDRPRGRLRVRDAGRRRFRQAARGEEGRPRGVPIPSPSHQLQTCAPPARESHQGDRQELRSAHVGRRQRAPGRRRRAPPHPRLPARASAANADRANAARRARHARGDRAAVAEMGRLPAPRALLRRDLGGGLAGHLRPHPPLRVPRRGRAEDAILRLHRAARVTRSGRRDRGGAPALRCPAQHRQRGRRRRRIPASQDLCGRRGEAAAPGCEERRLPRSRHATRAAQRPEAAVTASQRRPALRFPTRPSELPPARVRDGVDGRLQQRRRGPRSREGGGGGPPGVPPAGAVVAGARLGGTRPGPHDRHG